LTKRTAAPRRRSWWLRLGGGHSSKTARRCGGGDVLQNVQTRSLASRGAGVARSR
jgi:hypothetical protein